MMTTGLSLKCRSSSEQSRQNVSTYLRKDCFNVGHNIFKDRASQLMYVSHMCTHVVTSSKLVSTDGTNVRQTHVFVLHMPASSANVRIRFPTIFTQEPGASICWNLYQKVTRSLK